MILLVNRLLQPITKMKTNSLLIVITVISSGFDIFKKTYVMSI